MTSKTTLCVCVRACVVRACACVCVRACVIVVRACVCVCGWVLDTNVRRILLRLFGSDLGTISYVLKSRMPPTGKTGGRGLREGRGLRFISISPGT